MYSEAYLEGIRLFNAQSFWHAHEAWEECWHEAEEPDATFYKGIIQAAAALVHWQRGNLRGLHRNWAKSQDKLDTLPTTHLGLDLVAFRGVMDAFIAACDAGETGIVPSITLSADA
ncbi:MAG: DUF309 domain-containing protein [Chloroflexaceae bacterium]|nr:DUF309 domain-containing protein [Chloroflexaceae bacterium]